MKAGTGPEEAARARLLTGLVVFAFAMNAVARGMPETFAVFLLPVQESFGWSRSQMTGVYSVYMLVHGLAAPLAGMAFDRFGARACYTFGVLVLGAGYALAGSMSALWHYYLCIGVMAGIGVASMGMVPASALISRWFTGRLGAVMGLVYAAAGVGVLLLTPLTQLLLDQYAWRSTYRILGLGVLALLLPVAALPLRRMTRGAAEWRARRAEGGASGVLWTVPAAMRTGAFWGLFNVFFFTALSAYAILPQAVAFFIERGFNPLTAAGAFGLTGMLSVVGMVSIGWLSDRIGRVYAVTLSYLCSLTGIFSMFLIVWVPSLALVYGFVLFFGIAQGARGPIVSSLTARLFEGGSVGGIYGAITMGLGLGAAVGSWGSGLLQDWTGDYRASILLGAAGSASGLVQFWLVRSLRQGRLAGRDE